MALQLQDFPTMVKTQSEAVSTSCMQLIDMTVGSVVRALLEANASIGLWIQWLIVQVLSATRASTSVGGDLDSWVADFGMTRFEAVRAAGSVTFSRITVGLATTILPGVLVRTGIGATNQVFAVVEDIANPAWTGLGYALAATDSSVTVKVAAQVAGSAGNVVASSLTILGSAIPGVDAATNQLAMSGGTDAETDLALRTRFAGFLDSRNRATSQAVGFAISSIRQGVSYTIADRTDPSGATRPGFFTITVDDGTGAPTNQFISQVANAVDLVRPIGSTFSVRPPLVIPTSVQLTIIGSNTATASVQAAIIAYISAMPLGATLTITRLYQIAYSADVTLTNASGALINGLNSDYTPPIFGLLRPSIVSVIS